jgi:hypothetical protein
MGKATLDWAREMMSRKSARAIAAMLSLFALAVGAALWFLGTFPGTPEATDQATVQRAQIASPAKEIKARLEPLERPYRGSPAETAGSLQPESATSHRTENLTPELVASDLVEPRPSLQGVTDVSSDPDLVIGRPFPVSASVERECGWLSSHGGKKDEICDRVQQALSNMADQPRDPSWASKTEAMIRAVAASEGDKFAIRAVECRASACAAEVASTYGFFHWTQKLASDESIGKQLIDWDSTMGYETDSNGTRVTVTLAIFKPAFISYRSSLRNSVTCPSSINACSSSSMW